MNPEEDHHYRGKTRTTRTASMSWLLSEDDLRFLTLQILFLLDSRNEMHFTNWNRETGRGLTFKSRTRWVALHSELKRQELSGEEKYPPSREDGIVWRAAKNKVSLSKLDLIVSLPLVCSFHSILDSGLSSQFTLWWDHAKTRKKADFTLLWEKKSSKRNWKQSRTGKKSFAA